MAGYVGKGVLDVAPQPDALSLISAHVSAAVTTWGSVGTIISGGIAVWLGSTLAASSQS